MRAAFVIAAKDLRQRMRDRSAWVLGFLAPIAVSALMSFAFSGADTFHTTIAVVDEDHGVLSAAFTGFLSGPELASVLTVEPVSGTADARTRVDNGELGAALVIPAGFTAAAHGAVVPPIAVLTTVDAPLAGEVSRSIAESFVAQLNADRLAVATAIAAGAPAEGLAERAAGLRLPEQVVQRAAGTKRLRAVSYYAPGMGIFFTFFAIGFGARGYFLERRDGTLDRIAAAPVGPGTVLAGKSLATFAYATASLSTVAAVTSLAFGVDWGPLPAVAALIVAMALALVCLTAFVIAVAHTERQADGLASILTFGLVLLGGNFVFVSAAPEIMRKLTLFTPNGWAMRAFTDLAGGAGGASAIVPVLAILGFCVVLTAVVALLNRRAVAR
ncbi:ABC transporter permease [Amycolatopsis sp. NPDC059657]|uniref:ABC transporter permease n=1 Tax=Amycolatopsis sp. NPDC059657 TaxID=3346899 RepID=UPI00366C6D8A